MLVFELCVMLSAFNWNLCHVVSLGIKESDLCHSFVWQHSQQGISFLSGSMAGPVAVTFIIIFLPLELSFTSGMDAHGDPTIRYYMFQRSGSMHRTCINHSPRLMNRRQHLSLIAAEWLVGEAGWPHVSSQSTIRQVLISNLYADLKKRCIDFSCESLFTCPRGALLLCNVFCASDGSFSKSKKIALMMSSGLFIYVRLNRVRGDLTNETEDWVTLETHVFELDPRWAPGVRVSGPLLYWF